jgi:hypothetical protein
MGVSVEQSDCLLGPRMPRNPQSILIRIPGDFAHFFLIWPFGSPGTCDLLRAPRFGKYGSWIGSTQWFFCCGHRENGHSDGYIGFAITRGCGKRENAQKTYEFQEEHDPPNSVDCDGGLNFQKP